MNLLLPNTTRNTFSGATTGFIIASLSIIFDMIRQGHSFHESIIFHTQHLGLLAVLLSPFLLGVFLYVKTKILIHTIRTTEQTLKEEQNKTNNIYEFIEKLKQGNTDAEYELQGNKDVVGQALLDLQNNIKKNKEEEEARKKEDMQRSWINEGLAIFGDILRKDIDNTEMLSFNVISNLVKYLHANQGGFFILNDEDEHDKHFVMTACYAYDRKKFSEKRIAWGEGLIGTCAQEKDSIYIEEIPSSYISITSGLGKATPKTLFITPLKVNDEVHGVIELASFNTFTKYEIEFIEKVAENTASVISNTKINERTARLLKESREQAKALAENEEQVRQSMEELQVAQKEAARQSEKFISFTNTVNHTLLRAEYDTHGTLLYANTKFLAKMGYNSYAEVDGKHISLFINDKDKDWFFKIWNALSEGGRHFEGNMKHVTKQGHDLWTMSTYTCMRKLDGSIEKILFLGIDITEQKQQSLDYEGQINALQQSTIKATFTIEGEFMECNEKFLQAYGYDSFHELDEKKVYDIIERVDIGDFKKIWDGVVAGKNYQGILRGITKEHQTKWFNVNFCVVRDMYNEITKIIYIASDITKEKQMELDLQRQTEILRAQEEKLRQSEADLSKKLEKAKREISEQFKEMSLRHERTLEGLLDAIITIDSRGIIKFFNKAAEDLWDINRHKVLGHHIEMLFSEQTKKNNEFVKKLINADEEKIVRQRQEITITTSEGKDIQVLCLISEANVGNEHSYTAFLQKIEIELF